MSGRGNPVEGGVGVCLATEDLGRPVEAGVELDREEAVALDAGDAGQILILLKGEVPNVSSTSPAELPAAAVSELKGDLIYEEAS